MRKKDFGLEFIHQLKMDPPLKSRGLYTQFERRFGEIIGRGMLTNFYRKIRESETNPNYLKEFYQMKNQSLDAALLFNAGYQGDNYRQAINWIMDNHDVFGKEILDVGCECGVMSVFLGMAFADSKITAVDRCPAAIAAAKELAERMDVHNIEFICSEIHDLPDKQYDTVFCMRMLPENCDMSKVLQSYDFLLNEARNFAVNISEFGADISRLVKEHGFLVSMERCDVDPILLGWMQCLNGYGLTAVSGCYQEMKVKEMENEGTIQAFALMNEGMADPTEIYRFWCVCQSLHLDDANEGQYTGWYADMELQNFADTLLGGFLLQDPEGHPILTYSVWAIKDNPRQLMIYQAMGDEHILTFYEAFRRHEIMDQLMDMREDYVRQGAIAKNLRLLDGSITPVD